MNFEQNLVYHIFNQGNNQQKIFFNRDNYLYFLGKMRKHKLPHVDFLCYCLMPNHFHWLVRIHSVENQLDISALNNLNTYTQRFRSITESIAVMLRSYTRAINKQEHRTGSLFRPHTKYKTGWIDEFITVDKYRAGPNDFRAFPDCDYGWECFRYIHENPVKAGLCLFPEDWEFSSARDFAALRAGTLCNQSLAKSLLRLP